MYKAELHISGRCWINLFAEQEGKEVEELSLEVSLPCGKCRSQKHKAQFSAFFMTLFFFFFLRMGYINTGGRKLTFCSTSKNLGLAVEVMYERCFYRVSEFHSTM